MLAVFFLGLFEIYCYWVLAPFITLSKAPCVRVNMAMFNWRDVLRPLHYTTTIHFCWVDAWLGGSIWHT